MAADTFETVKRLLADGLSVDEGDIQPGSSITDDLGADSLDAVELIMTLEEEFNIEIDAEAAEGLKTVQDIVDLIDGLAA